MVSKLAAPRIYMCSEKNYQQHLILLDNLCCDNFGFNNHEKDANDRINRFKPQEKSKINQFKNRFDSLSS
jgi:hypothetical protein